MISNFLPKPNEIIEESIRFYESLVSFGYHAHLSIPLDSEIPDYGYQLVNRYDEDHPVETFVSLDPHPTPKLLNSLGWLTENHDDLPLICYFSRYIPVNPNEPRYVNTKVIEVVPIIYTKVVLDYDYLNKGKEFYVTKLSANSFNEVYYIAQLVPMRDRVPDTDDPTNDRNINKLSVQEPTNDNFKFLNGVREKEVGIKY